VRRLWLLLAILLGAVPASAGSTGANGFVSFGACCGNQVGIYVIRPNGTGQKRIYKPSFDDADLTSAWSPNGKRIAFVAPGGLWTMSPAGTGRKRVAAGYGETGAPTWSADGKKIAFVDLSRKGARKYALYVVGVAGGTPKRIVSGTPYVSDPAWSPSGKVIMFGRGVFLWTVRPDGKGSTKIAEGSSPSWSPDGHRVAFDRKGDVWTMNAKGAGTRALVRVPSATAGIAWSPDGKWIAYGTGDRGDIRLIRPDGTGARPLTHQPGLFNSWPAWQPKP
jgi:TolB protein